MKFYFIYSYYLKQKMFNANKLICKIERSISNFTTSFYFTNNQLYFHTFFLNGHCQSMYTSFRLHTATKKTTNSE